MNIFAHCILQVSYFVLNEKEKFKQEEVLTKISRFKVTIPLCKHFFFIAIATSYCNIFPKVNEQPYMKAPKNAKNHEHIN